MVVKMLGAGLVVVSGLLIIAGNALLTEYEEHTKTKIKLEASQESLNSYILAVKNLSIAQNKLAAKASNYQNKYTKASRELNNLKNREDVVLKKKGLVALKINKAFKKQQKGLACLTGDSTACGN